MKSQKYNTGELKELTINIEKQVAETVLSMAEVKGTDVNEIIVIALKRFIASHAELEGKVPKLGI